MTIMHDDDPLDGICIGRAESIVWGCSKINYHPAEGKADEAKLLCFLIFI